MANQSSSLRFDHREIAVIFMLFIFVSLLMFTVGILVGKGLTQAKYEGGSYAPIERNLSTSPSSHPAAVEPAEKHSTGSSVTTPTEPEVEVPAVKENTAVVEKSAAESTITLVPQKPKDTASPSTLLEPKGTHETESILNNPKLQALLEKDPKASRKLNSLGVPETYPSGKFSVQVGSYPTKTEAEERVNSLKKLGFPHAQFSAKQLVENKEVWYRVWLGFFPDYDSANEGGKALQTRGEVKQYIVRKVDSSGRPD